MATQIIRTGNTVAVEISEDLLRQANLSIGDPVEWRLTETGDLELQTPIDLGEHPGSEEGYEEWKMQQIEAGIAEHESRKSIGGNKVIEWLQSWGTEYELPIPK